jgi:hypothetical protein
VLDGDDLRELRLNCVYAVEALLGAYFVIAGFAMGGDDNVGGGQRHHKVTLAEIRSCAR